MKNVRKGLILDFDGVIVETEELHFASWNAAFEERFGVRATGSYHQIVGLTLEEIYAFWANAGEKGALELSSATKAELLARKTELLYEIGRQTLTPVPGVVELVKWAHGRDWYVTIASRGRRLRLLRMLELLQMPVYFDLIMGTEDVVDSLTDQKVHIRSVAPFGIQPASVVVVEDSASGVRSAKACQAGIVIGLTTSLTKDALRRAGADYTVDSLNEIPLLLSSSE